MIQTHVNVKGYRLLKHLLIFILLQKPCAAGYTTKASVHITCPVLEKLVFEVKDRNRRNLRCSTKPDSIASKAELGLVGLKLTRRLYTEYHACLNIFINSMDDKIVCVICRWHEAAGLANCLEK